MNDQQYFDQYKKSCEMIFSANPEDLSFVKDNNYKYHLMTTGMLNLIGRSRLDEVQYKSIEEIAKDSVLAEKFHKQDMYVNKSRKRGTYLEIIPAKETLRIVILHKTPIINPTSDNVVGIHGQCSGVAWLNVLKTLFNIHGGKGLLINHKSSSNPLEDYPINNTQHMVLFLCMNNYSYSEIALLMSEFNSEITPVRVNEYLEQLKLIFHVRTKTQLIEKAIGLNFHTLLPCNLFNNINSIDLKNEMAKIVCCNCKLSNCAEHSNGFNDNPEQNNPK